MLTKTEAIVLRTQKYGEKKIFVDMFCEEFGMLTFSCSAGNKSGRGGRNILLQPMNIVEVEFDMKPKATIHQIKDIRIAAPYMSIPFDVYKLSITFFVADFLRHALANEQQNHVIYEFISNSMQWLDTSSRMFSNFHIVFMISMSRFLGIYPNLDNYSRGMWFDMQDGCFVAIAPTHKQVLNPIVSNAVLLLARVNYSTMHLLRLSREERNNCAEKILTYYRLHIPNFPELKSFAILKQMFT